MFGFSKTKRENNELKFQNSILKELHRQDKKKISNLEEDKINLESKIDTIASDGLRKGSSVAGKHLVKKRIQKNERI